MQFKNTSHQAFSTFKCKDNYFCKWIKLFLNFNLSIRHHCCLCGPLDDTPSAALAQVQFLRAEQHATNINLFYCVTTFKMNISDEPVCNQAKYYFLCFKHSFHCCRGRGDGDGAESDSRWAGINIAEQRTNGCSLSSKDIPWTEHSDDCSAEWLTEYGIPLWLKCHTDTS